MLESRNRTIFLEEMALGETGLTVAVKDSIDIAGYPTRCASRSLEDAPPAVLHAEVVARLLAADCRILGKTNMHELAYGVTGVNSWTGTPPNPRFPDRIPGGSSSGSAAAVAAGLVDLALGTDTGGSVRMPAACCGVIGIKPTFGRISRQGVLPAQSSLDCVGIFARTMARLEQGMAILAPGFLSAPDPVLPRVGIVGVEADPAIAGAVHGAVRALAPCRSIQLSHFEDAFSAGLNIIAAENWRAFAHLADAPGLGPDVRARLKRAALVTAEQLAWSENIRTVFAAEVDMALENCDVLALPAMPHPPLLRSDADDPQAALAATAFLRPFNLSGHPAISLPLQQENGYAPAIQLIGRRGGDEQLCAVARLLERNIAPGASQFGDRQTIPVF